MSTTVKGNESLFPPLNPRAPKQLKPKRKKARLKPKVAQGVGSVGQGVVGGSTRYPR